jgi:hypothetical protein
MIDLLIILILNSLVCFGFYNACLHLPEDVFNNRKEQKGVLWFIEKWAINKWFYKPLCGCVPCMASFHSTYVYFTFLFVADKLELGYFIIYPLYILALSGLNYLIDRE